jgi:hypothetical protein
MPVIIVDDQDDPPEIEVDNETPAELTESVRPLGVPELNGISIRSYATSPPFRMEFNSMSPRTVSWAFRQDR